MTGPRINPDAHGPSGTFAALERATPIVQADGDVPTTTSMRVANGTGVQHKNVLELIGNNAADFAEFGPVAFETRPHPTQVGAMQRIAILNEEHATLLLTYMRNNDVVRDFKKRLVREFSALRRATATPPARPLALYPGRVDHDPTALYGADKFGAFYRADSVTYDPESDTSTIQFKPIPPIELDDFTADKMAQVEDKARLIQLFGGHW